MTAAGEVLVPLDEDSLRAAPTRWSRAGAAHSRSCCCTPTRTRPTNCAVSSSHHQWYPGMSVSVSHKIANEWREYERTSTTVVNAAIARTVASYLADLEGRLEARG